MKVQIGLLMAILLVMAGCNLNPLTTPTAMVATIEPTPIVDSGSSNTVPMTTQVDEHSGVAFDYPTGWTISPPPAQLAVAYSYSVASFDIFNPPVTPSKKQQGMPDGETEIQINFHASNETVESIRANLQSDVAKGMAKILKEEIRTGPDGSVAYYYEVEGMFEGSAYLMQTKVNGHTVSIAAYGKGDYFEDVAKSLRAA